MCDLTGLLIAPGNILGLRAQIQVFPGLKLQIAKLYRRIRPS